MASRSLKLHGQPVAEPASMALLSKGFRPFFLLGSAFAALAVPLWLLALRGGYQPGGPFGATQWHAHEMLFGFASAVIAGFLLTAIANWTGRETAIGLPLLALSGLWLAARLALFFAAWLPRGLPMLLDLGFLLALAGACARPIFAAKNARNYAFVGLLSLLFVASAWAHLGALRAELGWVRSAHRAALDVVLLMILVMSGRVVPMFTRNACQKPELRSLPALELAAVVCLGLLLLCDVIGAPSALSAPISALGGAFALLRMRHWGTRFSFREPLLWVLHLGALWLPLGLLLRAACAYWPGLPETSSLHSLTAGAIGTLTLGMMARVSLGHTGRMLRVPRFVAGAFALMVAAGVVRVAGPFLPSFYFDALVLSAALWSLAFATFLLAYAKILSTPRFDGK